jgi:hypothetical protein
MNRSEIDLKKDPCKTTQQLRNEFVLYPRRKCHPMSRVHNGIPIQQTHLSKRIHQMSTDHLCSYSTSPQYRRVGLQEDITMVE